MSDINSKNSSEGQTFKSEMYGYSFSLPSQGWKRLSKTDKNSLSAEGDCIDIEIIHSDFGSLFCIVEPNTNLDFESLWPVLESAYKAILGDFKEAEKKREIIASTPAMVIECEGVDHIGIGHRLIAYNFFKDGCLFQFRAKSTTTTYAQLKEEFIAAVKSFSFGEKSIPDDILKLFDEANKAIENRTNIFLVIALVLLLVNLIIAWITEGFWPAVGNTVIWVVVIGCIYGFWYEKWTNKSIMKKYRPRIEDKMNQNNITRTDLAPLIQHTYTSLKDIW